MEAIGHTKMPSLLSLCKDMLKKIKKQIYEKKNDSLGFPQDCHLWSYHKNVIGKQYLGKLTLLKRLRCLLLI